MKKTHLIGSFVLFWDGYLSINKKGEIEMIRDNFKKRNNIAI
ncbi:MAG: hypothetical protein ABIC36_00425 [bacterium]